MISLQTMSREDYDDLMSFVQTPEFLIQWSGSQFEYPLTYEQLDAYTTHTNEPTSNRFVYKVVADQTGKTVGHVSLGKVDRQNRSARIGKVLVDPSLRGQGVGEQMLKKVMRFAFEELNVHKVTLGVFTFNHSAIRCYKKVGFQEEGVLRDHKKVGDDYWSLMEMAIFDWEWKVRYT